MSKETRYIALLEEFARSGTSAKDFCQEQEICYKTFLRWANRLSFDVRSKRWHRGQHPASRMQLDVQNRRTHRAYEWLRTRSLRCVESCVWWSDCPEAGKQDDCVVLDRYIEDVRQQILSQLAVDGGRDGLLIDRILKCLGFCTLIEWWSFVEGAITKGKDGWKLAPALGQSYLAYNNAVMRGLKELGLTPTAAKGLSSREPASWETARKLAGMDDK